MIIENRAAGVDGMTVKKPGAVTYFEGMPGKQAAGMRILIRDKPPVDYFIDILNQHVWYGLFIVRIIQLQR